MARPLDLSATVTKINRAYVNLKVLNQEVREFIENDFAEVETQTYRRVLEWRQYPRSLVEALGFHQRVRFREVDADTLETRVPVRYDAIHVTLKKTIPTLAWGVRIGEIVNNLRGALDNLAYAIADSNAGPPPPNPISYNDPWRRVSFPVVMTEKYWKDTIVKDRAWCFRPGQLARLKKLQPFYRRQPANADRHWLRVLDELWNIDKHRTIHVVSVHPGVEGITLGPNDLLQYIEVKFICVRPPGPVKGDAVEIARFRSAMRRDRMALYAQADVKVNTGLTFTIAFDEGAPAYGANVMETLIGFLNLITAVILEFKPDISEPLPIQFFDPSPSHASPPSEGNAT
jgi:hypothetical protein